MDQNHMGSARASISTRTRCAFSNPKSEVLPRSRKFGVKSNLVYNQSELDLKNHKFVTRVKTDLF